VERIVTKSGEIVLEFHRLLQLFAKFSKILDWRFFVRSCSFVLLSLSACQSIQKIRFFASFCIWRPGAHAGGAEEAGSSP